MSGFFLPSKFNKKSLTKSKDNWSHSQSTYKSITKK